MAKDFVGRDVQPGGELDELLWQAVDRSSVLDSLRFLAQGAEIEFRNPTAQGRTPLLNALAKNDSLMVQFLQQWNGSFLAIDDQGRSALYFAVKLKDTKLVSLLLRKNVRCDQKDAHGQVRVFWIEIKSCITIDSDRLCCGACGS